MAVLANRRGNLRGDLTSFIGRRQEIAEVKRLIAGSRLVTLTGIGGVGKTRLMVRVAADLARAFEDGVWFVDLAPVADPQLVGPVVAAVVGVRDETAGSHSRLSDYFGDKRALMLLDNCEHLLDACALMVESVLSSAPEVWLLATSRQPLGVAGEYTFLVPPLSLPEPDRVLSCTELVGQYEALTLFVERAKAVAPAFAVTDENVDAVRRLAERVDGIPLALELAAARLNVLSVGQILARLDDRFRLLTSGPRTGRPQQRSLRSLIDWSFDLCTEDERTLWATVSVFPGDFDIEAVEAIRADDEVPNGSVLEALAGLVDKSVLTMTASSGDARYRLSETLREYGRERLEAIGQRDVVRRRHADYYVRLAERANTEWFGPRQYEWTAWMQIEHTNLRAALETLLRDTSDTDRGLAVILTLGLQWSMGGSLGEGRHFLDQVLAARTVPSRGRAIALWNAARLGVIQGDVDYASAAGEEAYLLARALGDKTTFGNAATFLGMARLLAAEVDAAESLFREAIESADVGNPLIRAAALGRLAQVEAIRGNYPAAAALCQEGISICEGHGEVWVRAHALWTLGYVELLRGNMAEASARARESLRIRSAFHDRTGTAYCLELLAWIRAADSEYDEAAWLLGATDALWQSLTTSLFPSFVTARHVCEQTVKRALTRRGFVDAQRVGADLAIDDVVRLALGERIIEASAGSNPEHTLTHREFEVARLVAEGLSNREIATRLVIAQRTAEGHVEHILTKLGFRSRSQIAVWVAKQRDGR
jgi:predicted ATPase/DNA-binding CsgD family transcriptional regulator